MSCISINLSRKGGNVNTSVERIGDYSSSVTRHGGDISSTVSLIGGMEATMDRKDRMSCAMYQVCTASISNPYLEISPSIVWMLAGHTENEVYSNTRWRVD